MSDQLAPFSLEMEEAVIGAVLTLPRAYYDVADTVREKDFFLLRHQHIWKAITRLVSRGEEYDFLTVSNELQNMGVLDEIGGAPYLLRLVNNTPSAALVDTYARVVVKAAQRRRLLEFSDHVKRIALDENSSIEKVNETVMAQLMTAMENAPEQRTAHLKVGINEVFNHVELVMAGSKVFLGLPTGFKALDAILNGLKRGNLIYVAGRPGTGKSAFLLTVALYAARQGLRGFFWTGEMSITEVSMRAMAAESGINSMRINNGQISKGEYSRLLEVGARVSELPLYINDTGGISLADLRIKTKRLAAQSGLDFIIVDYIGLMKAPNLGNRVQEIGYLSRGLKELAQELNIPVIAAAQLNRKLEDRNDKRPQLSDLRDSGDLEQDGNVVIFLNPNPENAELTDVIVAKHRGGATGDVSLFFDKPVTRFKAEITHLGFMEFVNAT